MEKLELKNNKIYGSADWVEFGIKFHSFKRVCIGRIRLTKKGKYNFEPSQILTGVDIDGLKQIIKLMKEYKSK